MDTDLCPQVEDWESICSGLSCEGVSGVRARVVPHEKKRNQRREVRGWGTGVSVVQTTVQPGECWPHVHPVL